MNNNCNIFEVEVVNNDYSIMKCHYPLVSSVRLYKIAFDDNMKFDKSLIKGKAGVYIIRCYVVDSSDSYNYYIGQTIDGARRMNDHKRDKINKFLPRDFLFCTVESDEHDCDIHAYLQELETKIISKADVTKLLNTNGKRNSEFKLTTAKEAIANRFVEEFISMANILGYNELFESEINEKGGIKVSLKTNDLIANGIRYANNTFMILKGSHCKARKERQGAKGGGNAEYDKLLWQSLHDNGIIKDGVFNEDRLFKSPSQAARIILGTSVNGLISWKVKDGRTLKVYLESLVEENL